MKNDTGKLILYSGLGLLCVALVSRWFGISDLFWIPALCLAILLKMTFLFIIFRSKDFKMSLWLLLIITGVIMIFLSLLFKYTFPNPLFRNILFYGAISFKITGLILMFVDKFRSSGK